jgi:hypothetical protein
MYGKTGSILLSFEDLPSGISRKDLKHFVQEAVDQVRGTSVRIAPAIAECTIVRLTDTATGNINHQGLVSVRPAKLALSIIDKLQQTTLNGAYIKVSRYRHCSFDVNAGTRTKSMTDLLGGERAGTGTTGIHLRLDLVPDTGVDDRAQIAAPREPAQVTSPTGGARRRVFAH